MTNTNEIKKHGSNCPIFQIPETEVIIPQRFWGLSVRSKWAVALFRFLFKRFGRGLLEYFVGRNGIEMEDAKGADEFIEYYLQSIYTNLLLACLCLISTSWLWLAFIMVAITINIMAFKRQFAQNPWGLIFDKQRGVAFLGIFNRDKVAKNHFSVGSRPSLELTTLSIKTITYVKGEKNCQKRTLFNIVKNCRFFIK